MKGIVLAGGSGTRLHPVTLSTSKALLPVYDKPMIYYAMSVLMQAGIRDILLISTPEGVPALRGLLGDGEDLGLALSYAEQAVPRGDGESLVIGARHAGSDPVALVLGDNVFDGPGLPELLRAGAATDDGCLLFGCHVPDPERYGVAEVDEHGRLLSLEEKPSRPRSTLAATGLYFYDGDAVEIAKGLRPSWRGELEITDVNQAYIEAGKAGIVPLGERCRWFDAGTYDSLFEVSRYVRLVERREGRRVACLEEIALRMGFITPGQCFELGERLGRSEYGRYVMRVAQATASVSSLAG
ncbi:glucose-1-phosphate thymidylyltransferase RfbA [Geodermatophilus maliterrae]|uniref:Glucose-1-phosphate thymidylyltransferase n=1 Tax=Geodermatophilus maliterrae TaxID=3162531 RepID=A0ABV3XM65_9ACTN